LFGIVAARSHGSRRPAIAFRAPRRLLAFIVSSLITLMLLVTIPLDAAGIFNTVPRPPIGSFEASASLLPAQTNLDRTLLVAPLGSNDQNVGDDRLTVVNAGTDETRSVASPFPISESRSGSWIAEGDAVVGVLSGQHYNESAVAFVPGAAGTAAVLGRATRVFAAATPNSVWLIVEPQLPVAVPDQI